MEKAIANHRGGACRVVGGWMRRALSHHARTAGAVRAVHGEVAGTCSFPPFSIRNALDAGPRGNAAHWRSSAGFFSNQARPYGEDSTCGFDLATPACGSRLRQLHLTAFPAGGSRPQRSLL